MGSSGNKSDGGLGLSVAAPPYSWVASLHELSFPSCKKWE